MREMKKRLLAGASALAIIMTSGVPAAFAEGSRELVDMTGKTELASNEISGGASIGDDKAYRTYLEWRDRPQLGDVSVDPITGAESTTNQIQSKSVFYVYAKAGETVYFGQSGRFATDKSITAVAAEGVPTDAQISSFASSYQPLRGSTIAVTMPVDDKTAFDPTHLGTGAVYAEGSEINKAGAQDTRIFLFKPQDKKGVITNTVQEQIGPKYGDDAERNLKGYDPFSFVAPVTGTYSFRFIGQNYVTSDHETIARPTATPAPTRTPERTPAPGAAPTPDPETVFKPLPAGIYPVSNSQSTIYGASNIDAKETTTWLGSEHYIRFVPDGHDMSLQFNNSRIVLGGEPTGKIEFVPAVAGTLKISVSETVRFKIEQGGTETKLADSVNRSNPQILEYHVAAGRKVSLYADKQTLITGIELAADPVLYPLENGKANYIDLTVHSASDANDNFVNIGHFIATNGTPNTSAASQLVFGRTVTAAAELADGQYVRVLPSESGVIEVAYSGEGTISASQNGSAVTPSCTTSVSGITTAYIPVAANKELRITASGAVSVYGVRQRRTAAAGEYVFGDLTQTNTSATNGDDELYEYTVGHSASGTTVETGEDDAHKKNVFSSESGTYIKLSGAGSYTNGSIDVIPSVSDTVTVLFGAAQTSGTVTLTQPDGASASETAEASGTAGVPGRLSSVSISAAANKPVYIYGSGEVYIYGIMVGAQTAGRASLMGMNTFAAMGEASLSEAVTETVTYDFENSYTPFIVGTNDSNETYMQLAFVDDSDLNSKTERFYSGSARESRPAYAYYDFSSLAEGSTETTVEFDCKYAGRGIFTLGDASVRGTSSSASYNNNGAIFRIGTTNNTNTYINDQQINNDSSTRNVWLHVKVTANWITGTQSYEVKKKSDGSVVASASNVRFYNASAAALTQLDIFDYAANQTHFIDNLTITAQKDNSSHKVTFNETNGINSTVTVDNMYNTSYYSFFGNGEHTFAAKADGYKDHSGSFSISGADSSVDYTMEKGTDRHYSFNDTLNPFTDDNRISSNIEDGILVFTNANNSENDYAFAHYNFSSLVNNSAETEIEFDYFNTNGGRGILSLGDAAVRGNTGGSKKATYSNTGAAFALGSTGNGSYLNGNTATELRGKWLHVKVTVDEIVNKYSYKITNGESTLAEENNISFLDTNAGALNQIDVFSIINNSKCVLLDNLSIKVNKYKVTFSETNNVAASVSVDGNAVTPGTATALAPGEHTITATAEGCKNYSKTITVEPGDTAVQFTMIPEGSYAITKNNITGVTLSAAEYAAPNTSVTVTAAADTGYVVTGVNVAGANNEGSVEVTSNGDGTYTFTMPAYDVTATAVVDGIYTVQYLHTNGTAVKDPVTRQGNIGDAIALTDADKVKTGDYYYDSDDAAGKTIAAGGTTVVTVTFRDAEPYTATVHAYIEGTDTLIGTYSQTAADRTESVTVYYNKYIKNGDNYYVIAQNSEQPYYGVKYTAAGDTAKYYSLASDVSYATEVETLSPSKTWAASGEKPDLYSMGSAKRLQSSTYAELSEWVPNRDANVTVILCARNKHNPTGMRIYVRDADNNLSEAGYIGDWATNNYSEKSISNISVPAGGKVVLNNTDTWNSNLEMDYVVIKATYKYNVTVNSTEGGTAAASPEGSRLAGDTVTLANTPAEGYVFSNYVVTNNDTGAVIEVTNDSFIMPAADVTVNAVFRPLGINFISKSVTGQGTLAVTPEKDSYTEGETVSVNVSASAGSRFASLYYTYEDAIGDVHFAQLTPDAGGNASFTMPNSPVKVKAAFGYNVISIADTTGGYISLDQSIYQWSDDGSRIAATGAAVSGAYIPETYFNLENLVVNIYDGTTGAAVPYTDNGNGTFSFTMPENSVIITATFADSRVALAELPVNEAASPGAISTSVNGVDSGAELTTGVIDKTNQYLGLYGSASASGSSVTISSDIDKLNGVLEVIPAASGVINITYSGNNGKLFVAQTDVFTAESIKKNTIAVTTDTAETLKAVVESHAPVYIYTAGGSAGVDNVAINTSTNLAGDEWSLETTSSLVGAWDITVVSNDNGTLTEHKGRVWTDIMFLNARAYKQSIYSSPYILTDDGYEYRFSFNGMQPFSAIFFSNSRGFLADRVGEDGARNVQPLYHSYYSHGRDGVGVAPSRDEVTGFKTVTYSNFTPHEAGIDKTHRLFLNELNKDSTAVGVYSTGWATGATHGIFDMIEPTYEGYGGNAKNDGAIHKGTIGSGGKFEFTVTKGVTTSWDAATATLTVSPEDLQAINGKIFCLALNYSEYALNANRVPITHQETYTFEDEFEDDGVTPKTKLVDVWTKVSALGGAAHNPEAEEGNIVVLAAAIYLDDNTPSKTFSMVWDGKDVYGNDVPVTIEHYDANGVLTNDGSYYTSNTAESQGEVHMPMADVEAFPHGVKIERINSLEGASTENAGEVAYSKYRLYYNNQAEAPGYSKNAETGQVVYDYTGKTSWYFVGRTQQPYVTRIGDGLNGTAGVNTQNEGGMKVGNYPFVANAQSTYDNTYAAPTAEPGWYKDQSSEELYSAYDAAYGNEAALDMWTRFVASLSKTLNYGVNPRNNKDKPAPIVSFVAEDGKTELEGDFSQSHVKLKSGDTYFYPGNHGRPMYWQIMEEANDPSASDLESFGNTISTGFISNFNVEDGVTYNAVMWDITVPIGENTLVKLPDEGDDNDNGFTSGWTSLKGDKKGNLTDTDSITIKNSGKTVEYDNVINKGSIYETAHNNADEFVIRAKHEIPQITGDESGTTQVVVGLIIDNIYAPDAKAIAAYVDVTDKTETLSDNTTKIVYSAYHRDSAHTELVYDTDKLNGDTTDQSPTENRLGAIHVILSNATNGEGAFELFKSNRFNYYTGENRTPDKATTSAEDEEAWFLSRDKAVSFWESLEENESFGDISDEANAEANGSGDGISMDDLSNGIETIDDILGQN